MYNALEFEWDEEKNDANRRKHGIDFETAAHVFDDPNYILEENSVDEGGEPRWQAIGLSDDLPLLVIHVYRSLNYGEEIIRIISARKASARESRRYFGQAAD